MSMNSHTAPSPALTLNVLCVRHGTTHNLYGMQYTNMQYTGKEKAVHHKNKYTLAGFAEHIMLALKDGDVIVKVDKDLFIESNIEWNSGNTLTLVSKKDIIFAKEDTINIRGTGSLYLKAGIENNDGEGSVIFHGEKQVYTSEGKVYIYYNPSTEVAVHKYHQPYSYSKHVGQRDALTAYMLINDIQDLQDVKVFLSGNYALSRDIDASVTKEWNHGKGFSPLRQNKYEQPTPFSGNFDGNNYKISQLFINRSSEDYVGLFGIISGSQEYYSILKDVTLIDTTVVGKSYVGLISGMSEYVNFTNTNLLEGHLSALEIAGSMVGSGHHLNIETTKMPDLSMNVAECYGVVAGAIKDSLLVDSTYYCNESLDCFGYRDIDSVTIIEPVEYINLI